MTRPPEPEATPGAWHVYLVRRADGALYAGITTDVGRRFAEHCAGGPRAARALRGRGPLRLVYRARLGGRRTALAVECRIKKLRKSGKEALVAAQPGARALLRRLGLQAGSVPGGSRSGTRLPLTS